MSIVVCLRLRLSRVFVARSFSVGGVFFARAGVLRVVIRHRGMMSSGVPLPLGSRSASTCLASANHNNEHNKHAKAVAKHLSRVLLYLMYFYSGPRFHKDDTGSLIPRSRRRLVFRLFLLQASFFGSVLVMS